MKFHSWVGSFCFGLKFLIGDSGKQNSWAAFSQPLGVLNLAAPSSGQLTSTPIKKDKTHISDPEDPKDSKGLTFLKLGNPQSSLRPSATPLPEPPGDLSAYPSMARSSRPGWVAKTWEGIKSIYHALPTAPPPKELTSRWILLAGGSCFVGLAFLLTALISGPKF